MCDFKIIFRSPKWLLKQSHKVRLHSCGLLLTSTWFPVLPFVVSGEKEPVSKMKIHPYHTCHVRQHHTCLLWVLWRETGQGLVLAHTSSSYVGQAEHGGAGATSRCETSSCSLHHPVLWDAYPSSNTRCEVWKVICNDLWFSEAVVWGGLEPAARSLFDVVALQQLRSNRKIESNREKEIRIGNASKAGQEV